MTEGAEMLENHLSSPLGHGDSGEMSAQQAPHGLRGAGCWAEPPSLCPCVLLGILRSSH